MKLSELMNGVAQADIAGGVDPEISGLHCDSRTVRPGGLFFALKGVAADGHAFIPAAVASGAAAVVVEDEVPRPDGVAVVTTTDARLAMARAAAAYYGDPTGSAPLVGITGTNGKTTTTYLVEAMLTAAGLPAAVLGTISYRFGDFRIESTHTTPESTDLQRILRELADAGARSYVMEVSSHALEQKRVDGCRFDVGVFTNLTRDHLDYHGSMEQYLKAKVRLFAELLAPDSVKPRRMAAVNMDDPYGEEIVRQCACPVVTFGRAPSNDVHGVDVGMSVDGISGTIRTPGGAFPFTSMLLGKFNLSNILAAAAAGAALGLPLAAVRRGIEAHLPVPGRLERVPNGRGVTCLVDYAHTGDALDNVLATLSEIAAGRIITVFGCGGDRDRGKRPIMGGVAARWSHLAIVTSDNPRTEEPLGILAQIREGILPAGIREYTVQELASGFEEKGFVLCVSRAAAIRLGAAVARPGDILLLAGKGHEDYQIIGTTKHHFDDREEAAAALKG